MNSQHTVTVRVVLAAASLQAARELVSAALDKDTINFHEIIDEDDSWEVGVWEEGFGLRSQCITVKAHASSAYNTLVGIYFEELKGGKFEAMEFGDGLRKCIMRSSEGRHITIEMRPLDGIPF